MKGISLRSRISFIGGILLLAFLCGSMPLISIPCMVLFSILVIGLQQQMGCTETGLLGMIAMVIIAQWLPPAFAVCLVLFGWGSGAIVAWGSHRQWHSSRLWVVTMVYMCVCIGLLCIGIQWLESISILTIIQQESQKILQMAVSQYDVSQVIEDDRLIAAKEVKEIAQLIPYVLPGTGVVIMSILAYVVNKFGLFLAQRGPKQVAPFAPIRSWEIGWGVLYLYILSLIIKYWGDVLSLTWVYVVGVNLMQVSFFFVSVQGLASIFSMLHRKYRRKGVQVLCLFLFFCMPLFSYITFILGAISMVANYRKK